MSYRIMNYFKAPWGRKLKTISGLITILLVVVPITSWYIFSDSELTRGNLISIIFPLLILFAASLYTIRRYVVTPHEIIIERPIGPRRYPLTTLKKVLYEPALLDGSRRLFANGGLYSFSGTFTNKTLGTYQAYLTDGNKAVILFFEEGPVVVSPGDPQAFIDAIMVARQV